MAPKELLAISDTLSAGRIPEPVPVRTFLDWFDAHRRGWRVVSQIREALDEVRVVTTPDFESRWIDALIAFSRPDEASDSNEPQDGPVHEGSAANPGGVGEEVASTWISKDATYRISKLAAANSGVERIAPDASLQQAVTLMLTKDYSQLPVMSNERDVRGIISWRSIGSRLALGQAAGCARELMESANEVRADVSIFEAITLIVQHDYVLVRGEANKITGIVTASDLSLQFRTLTEPFLLLSEIENLIRNMIGERFNAGQLAEARDPDDHNRDIQDVADLTFGEYIRLLENPNRWGQLALRIDRQLFCQSLDRVRTIRNDVMHFDPDGITGEDLGALRDFTRFLKSIEEIRSVGRGG